MHWCIYFCSLIHSLYKEASAANGSVPFAHSYCSNRDKMLCYSLVNSTYTCTHTLLPATAETAEVDWITLWIFSCYRVNTLTNMRFINMPGATPSPVRQRLISYSNTERQFSEFQPAGENINCAAKHILYYPSVLDLVIITWVWWVQSHLGFLSKSRDDKLWLSSGSHWPVCDVYTRVYGKI